MKSLVKEFYSSNLSVIHITLNHQTPPRTTGSVSCIVHDARSKLETIRAILLGFTLVDKRGAAFHPQTQRALWIMVEHVPLKATVLCLIFLPPGKVPQYLSHKQWRVHTGRTKVSLTLFSSNPTTVLCSDSSYTWNNSKDTEQVRSQLRWTVKFLWLTAANSTSKSEPFFL